MEPAALSPVSELAIWGLAITVVGLGIAILGSAYRQGTWRGGVDSKLGDIKEDLAELKLANAATKRTNEEKLAKIEQGQEDVRREVHQQGEQLNAQGRRLDSIEKTMAASQPKGRR